MDPTSEAHVSPQLQHSGERQARAYNVGGSTLLGDSFSGSSPMPAEIR